MQLIRYSSNTALSSSVALWTSPTALHRYLLSYIIHLVCIVSHELSVIRLCVGDSARRSMQTSSASRLLLLLLYAIER